MLNLAEKVDWEYNRFKQHRIIESKDRIFISANEICLMKRIRDIIKNTNFTDVEENILFMKDNILDKICSMCNDNSLYSDEEILKAIRKYID